MSVRPGETKVTYYARHSKWGRAGGRIGVYRFETFGEARAWCVRNSPASDGETYVVEREEITLYGPHKIVKKEG